MKVFLDTNIIFSLIKTYQQNNNKLDKSFLLDHNLFIDCYFSVYWMWELNRNLKKKWLDNSEWAIIDFFNLIWIKITDSVKIEYKQY